MHALLLLLLLAAAVIAAGEQQQQQQQSSCPSVHARAVRIATGALDTELDSYYVGARQAGDAARWHERLTALMQRELAGSTKDVLEGFSAKQQWKTRLYQSLVTPLVQTVCEIGFNGGHSTATWLSASPRTVVYSFDLGEHGYARPAALELQAAYPGRLHVAWGDSTRVVPEFERTHGANVSCDILHVDGGHFGNVPARDIQNMHALAHAGSVLIVDDTGCTQSYCVGRTVAALRDTDRLMVELLQVDDALSGLSVLRYRIARRC